MPEQAVYADRFAALYDRFFADKPYEAEAAFVHRILTECGVPIRDADLIEFACGTGTHAFEFERLGYRVVASDISEMMLSEAREKARMRGSSVEFRIADMRTADFGGGRFDAAVCLFDSIGYAVSNDGVLAALRSMRRSLRDAGIAVLEFWHAAALLRRYEPVRVRTWKDARSHVVRIARTTLDVERSTAEVDYEILELFSDDAYRRYEETHVNRFFSVPEMAALLDHAGLSPVAWYGGYEDRGVCDDTWHVLVVARAQMVG